MLHQIKCLSRRPRPHRRRSISGVAVFDLIYVAVAVAVFALLGLIAKGMEKL